MCGLVYVKRKDGKPAYKAVLKRYRKQKTRGTDGYGYVAIKDGKVVSYKRASKEHEIVKLIEQEDAPEILFHHRFPTSVPNIEEGNHPILVQHEKLLQYKYYIVHNGVIKNKEELFKKHTEMGFKYTTQINKMFESASSGKTYHQSSDYNDSESIAIQTALTIEQKVDRIGTEGAAAVIGIKVDDEGKVLSRFFYRNDVHPLHFSEDGNMLTITTMGHGEMIKADFVKYLKAEGGYGEMTGKTGRIFTPWGYKYSGGGSQHHSHNRLEYEDDDRDFAWGAHTRTEEHKPPSILIPERTMGFRVPREEEVALDFLGHNRASDAGFGALSIDEILRGSSTYDAMVRKLSEDSLWAQYDMSVGSYEEVEAELSELDGVISSGEDLTAEIMGKQANLMSRKNAIKRYGDALEREITRRESTPVGTAILKF